MTALDADLEARAAASGDAGKSAYVRRIFTEIAPRYDLLNRLLSFNIDRGWRRSAIAALHWHRRPSGLYVDLCAGTLDIAAQLAAEKGFRGRVLAADFAEPMLREGSGKIGVLGVSPVVADALDLPLPDGIADGAIMAFGARNLSDLGAGLREMHRVLAPGARFVILDFSTPPRAMVRHAYNVYFHHALPMIGGVISGHPSAYRYLPRSVANFPSPEALAEGLRNVGFADVSWTILTLGVAAVHVGRKEDRR